MTEEPLTKEELEHVEWCRHLFATLQDGGTWAIPRSGLIFRRYGNTLVLHARMPHDPRMPVTPAQLEEQQQDDFDITKRYFGAAGITVIEEDLKKERET